jgi:hypothetical protein
MPIIVQDKREWPWFNFLRGNLLEHNLYDRIKPRGIIDKKFQEKIYENTQ